MEYSKKKINFNGEWIDVIFNDKLSEEDKTKQINEWRKEDPIFNYWMDREDFHPKFMNYVLEKLNIIVKKPHDYTKSPPYNACTKGKFNSIIPPEYKKIFDEKCMDVINMHRYSESHHPEFNHLEANKYIKEDESRIDPTTYEFSVTDLRETACDRLCRNAEANNGKINVEEIITRWPLDYRGKNAEDNILIVHTLCKKYAQQIEELYLEFKIKYELDINKN